MEIQNHIYNANDPRDARRGVTTLEAVALNNQALEAGKAGNHKEAEKLHKEALVLKELASGPNSVGYALSANRLGAAQIKLQKWDEAETNLTNAVRILEVEDQVFDAAVSREYLAQVYEARGNFEMARAIRSSKPQEIACSNFKCSFQGTFKLEDLKQCGQCKSTFYCREQCQKADWKARHKNFCKPLASN